MSSTLRITTEKFSNDCDSALQLAKSFVILKASMADVDRFTEDLDNTEILIQADSVYDRPTYQETWDALHAEERQLEELEAKKVDRMIQVIR